MRAIILTTYAAAFVGLAAAETPSINPGEWESTIVTSVAMNMNGQMMALPGQTTSSTDCITEEDAEFSPEDFAQDGCTASNFETTATTASFDMACNQNGIAMTGSMQVEAASSGDAYSGTFNIQGAAPGMGDMNVTGSLTGARIGACSE